jgi:predicted alpha/beta-fold hydrolase
VRAWQVLYRSTNGRGDADAVSGTVMVPDTPWLGGGPRPIVSYAVGTHGLGDQCAPSYTLATGAESEYIVAMSLALAKGWAVAVTDYEGLGTPGDHAYMVSISAGRAALDIARAAARIPGAGLTPQAPIALWGYSQGGAATASAAEQAKDYAPAAHRGRSGGRSASRSERPAPRTRGWPRVRPTRRG